MRFTPQLRDLHWLVARPIAHRGLHDEKNSVVENCEKAFASALTHGYSIECDIELTKDGEAVVFHDDEIDRVMDGTGPVRSFSARQLKAKSYKQGKDKIQTLGELLEQVDGRQTLVIEIKSLWDDDLTLTLRALQVLADYQGPYALMSFDPHLIACVAERAPHTVRGITADRVTDPYYQPLSIARRLEMQSFSHLPKSRPHFVSFDANGFPFAAVGEIREKGHPIICWTIRTPEQASRALRYCDQITFENYRPA
ncbi:MAG: glycerophosphodiester phosphodiesterase [Alphaproteobacteria bacterium]|nr:glycerophosphodiester phosphodiesterase [Alphaproteobacteria bacterium]